jgi:hypothetical protein
MISLHPRRLLPLLVLLYITADFIDPAAPGVFFFDHDAFFVDSVIQFKSRTPRDLARIAPIPTATPAHSNCEIMAASLRAVARPLRPQHRHWRAPTHDGSPSFDSSSPSDSSATALA